MNADWVLSFIAVAGIGATAYIARRIQGSWVAPGAAFAGVWFIATALALLLSPTETVYTSGYVVALMFVVVSVAGSSISMMSRRKRRDVTELGVKRMRILRRVYWITLTLGALAPFVVYFAIGRSYMSSSIMYMAAAVSKARYTEEFTSPLSLRLAYMFLYLTALSGGFLAATEQAKRRIPWATLLWIIPATITTLITTERALVLICILSWVSGLVSGMAFTGAFRKLRISKIIIYATTALTVVFAFFVLTQLFRWGSLEQDNTKSAAGHINTYFSGHMTAFGYWIDHRNECPGDLEMGKVSFAGVAQMMGLYKRDLGLFTEYVDLGNGETTNIYTGLRPLIEDFSIPGALAFTFVFAALGGFGWVLLRKGKLWGAPVVASYLLFVFLSPITCVYTYSSTLGAVVLFTILLAWLDIVPNRTKKSVMRAANV